MRTRRGCGVSCPFHATCRGSAAPEPARVVARTFPTARGHRGASNPGVRPMRRLARALREKTSGGDMTVELDAPALFAQENRDRWEGIVRPYSEADVRRLRGSYTIRHTI